MSSEVSLSMFVSVAPKSVTISGHDHAKAGETITLKCESEISNPAADITWIRTGRQVNAKRSEVKPSPKVRSEESKCVQGEGMQMPYVW